MAVKLQVQSGDQVNACAMLEVGDVTVNVAVTTADFNDHYKRDQSFCLEARQPLDRRFKVDKGVVTDGEQVNERACLNDFWLEGVRCVCL